jgi:hypothetical protein
VVVRREAQAHLYWELPREAFGDDLSLVLVQVAFGERLQLLVVGLDTVHIFVGMSGVLSGRQRGAHLSVATVYDALRLR